MVDTHTPLGDKWVVGAGLADLPHGLPKVADIFYWPAYAATVAGTRRNNDDEGDETLHIISHNQACHELDGTFEDGHV